jgi:hypothetical protein
MLKVSVAVPTGSGILLSSVGRARARPDRKMDNQSINITSKRRSRGVWIVCRGSQEVPEMRCSNDVCDLVGEDECFVSAHEVVVVVVCARSGNS